MSLEVFFDQIVASAPTDVESQEIQDITSALEEFLYRYARYIEQVDSQFKLAYIQRAGSTAEKTALWKVKKNEFGEHKYIEFDYLVVLDDELYKPIECEPCQACVELRVNKDGKRKLVRGYTFNRIFHNKLHSNIAYLCSCSETSSNLVASGEKSSPAHFRSIKDGGHQCAKCNRVAKDTGFLELATKALDKDDHEQFRYRAEYSLAFYWTSGKDSLTAPDFQTLRKTERIKRLLIHVDYLLAFEIDTAHIGEKTSLKRYIVPKRCPVHLFPTRWRLSYCASEIDIIRNQVSDPHRKCYIVLKFLFSQFILLVGFEEFISGYYLKVAFLNHCLSCEQERKRQRHDSVACVIDVLQRLQFAYKMRSLKTPFSDIDLLHGLDFKNGGYFAVSFFLVHIVSELRLYFDTDQKPWCQHSAGRGIGIISKTVQELREGRLWLDADKDSVVLKTGLTYEVSPEERFLILKSATEHVRLSTIYRDVSRTEKLESLQLPDSVRALYLSPAAVWRIWFILEKIGTMNLDSVVDQEQAFKDLLEKYRKSQEVRAQRSSQRLFQTISQTVNEHTSGERHGCMSNDVYADCDCDITNKQLSQCRRFPKI